MSEENMPRRLRGKIAVVTGGASGIGRSIVERFLQEGASCVAADLVDIDPSSFADFTDDVASKVRTFKVDVSNCEQVEAMIDFCVQEFGTIDILCNNAGISDKLEPIAELEDASWQRLMRIDLDSVMYGTRAAVRQFLKEEKEGVIVNTASLSGVQAGKAGVAYTAAKYGVVGLTKNTAYMYSDKGIRCNCVCPAATQTALTAEMSMSNTSALGMKKSISGVSGLPRSAKPEEISSAIAFLASDDASYVNGAALMLDAGWSCY